MAQQAVLSIFGVKPGRIGSNEAFARELSRQLGARNWRSVQCFLEPPAGAVRQFLELPNVTLDSLRESFRPGWAPARSLAALLRRHAPKILHLHYTPFLGPYPWTARACGVPEVFITDHTSRPEGYVAGRAPLWKRSLTRLINLPVTGVVSVSDYGYRCMTSLDVLPQSRFTRIYNGVDLPRIVPDASAGERFRQRYGIPADRTLVLQVSWIIPEKGILDLLAAARLMVSSGSPVHFAFVGEGAHRAEYTRLAEEMGLKDFVTWTGMVGDPLAEGVYSAADVVCQVSRWEEVFGWTIAEAMAHGKPLVGTRVGGIPELVQDSVTGFLVDRGNVAAMVEKISLLARSPGLRQQMGAAGRRDAEKKFDLTRNVSRLLELYGV